MRGLTKRQKNILKKWYQENLKELKPFCIGKIEELPTDIYAKLIEENETEILYQETNRYLEDLCFDRVS